MRIIKLADAYRIPSAEGTCGKCESILECSTQDTHQIVINALTGATFYMFRCAVCSRTAIKIPKEDFK